MGNRTRNFQREDKARWCFQGPIVDSFDRRAPVKRGVHFYRVEARAVEIQVIRRLHALGIERALPAVRREGACSEADFGLSFALRKIQCLWDGTAFAPMTD